MSLDDFLKSLKELKFWEKLTKKILKLFFLEQRLQKKKIYKTQWKRKDFNFFLYVKNKNKIWVFLMDFQYFFFEHNINCYRIGVWIKLSLKDISKTENTFFSFTTKVVIIWLKLRTGFQKSFPDIRRSKRDFHSIDYWFANSMGTDV